MKIRDFIERGRELYAHCSAPHPTIWPGGFRHVPLDLSKLDPEMHDWELKGRVRCSVCGRKDTVSLIRQTDRQMRQGRQR